MPPEAAEAGRSSSREVAERQPSWAIQQPRGSREAAEACAAAGQRWHTLHAVEFDRAGFQRVSRASADQPSVPGSLN